MFEDHEKIIDDIVIKLKARQVSIWICSLYLILYLAAWVTDKISEYVGKLYIYMTMVPIFFLIKKVDKFSDKRTIKNKET